MDFPSLRPVCIDSREIGRGKPVFIVAEIGTGHGGHLDKARRLIDAAAEAGADCVKSQVVFADEIVHPKAGLVDLPGGRTPLYKVFENLERDTGFYERLKRYTEDAGLFFLCAPFGVRSSELLKSIDIQAVKVASPEINHIPLLEHLAEWDVPVVLSTGVSTLADIERAVSILPESVILLQCVTAYPALVEEYNVASIGSMSAIFGKQAGISDHSLDPVLVPVLSVLAGGCLVEKHLTMSNDDGGLDDKIALDPASFSRMAQAIRRAEKMTFENGMSYLAESYSMQTVLAALGNGAKTVAESERGIYRTTNRSIMAIADISAGMKIGPENVALLRSEKNLSPGLPPVFLSTIVGRTAVRNISNGTGLTWDDF